MGTWVPTMPSRSASLWQIRFCSSIFRCGCVCGARSDEAKRDGTSGGGSSRGDGLSDQSSTIRSLSTQTRRYILSVHRRNSTSFCPSSRRLAERARLTPRAERDGRIGSKCEELKVSTMSRLYPRKLTCERTSVDFAFVPFADVAGIPVDARNFVLFV